MKARIIIDTETFFFELEEDIIEPEDIPKLIDVFCESIEYLKVKELIEEEK